MTNRPNNTPKAKRFIKLVADFQDNITLLPFAGGLSYARHMTELDQAWSELLGDAYQNAAAAGKSAVADYLRLKATNDALRVAGVKWLFQTLIEIAGEAARTHAALTIERQAPHRFTHGNSQMVGSQLVVRQGVRCLTIEAGWTRTPGDGIMLGGALALARLHHFGLPRLADEYRLVPAVSLPIWIGSSDEPVVSGHLRDHFKLFLNG